MDNLIKAIIKNDVAQVQQLLQQGADPNGYQDQAKVTPLHFAAQHNAHETALALILAGAKVNATTSDGLSPLDVAKLHRHENMIKLLENAAQHPASV